LLCLLWIAPPCTLAQTNVEEEISIRFENARRAEQRGEIIRAESEYRYVLGLSLSRLGAIYSRLSDFPAAERAFSECVQAIATSEEGLMGLGVNYLRAGEYEKGIDVAQKLLDLNPFNADARRLLGKIYLMQKKYQEGTVELAGANRMREDFSTSYALALAYMNMGQLNEVQKLFDKMAEKAGNTAQVHLLFGRAYREIRQVDLALAEFRKALDVDPNFPRVHYYMGLTYLSAEANPDIDKALQEFKMEAQARPNEFPPQFFIGVIYARKRNFDEGIVNLRRAIELDPRNFKARYYLGLVLAVAQRCQEAIPELRKAIEVSDASTDRRSKASVHYQLGRCLQRIGQMEEAQEQSKIAQSIQLQIAEEDRARLEAAPQLSLDVMTGRDLDKPEEMGLALIEEPLEPEEQQRLKAAQPVFGRMAATAYNGIALLYASKSDLPKAIDNLRLAAGWDASVPDLYYNLGLAYFRQHKYKDALPALEKAVEKDPKNMAAKRLLGIVCFITKDYARAAEMLSAVVSDVPEKDPQTSYSLVLALVQLNRIDEAKPIVDKLLAAAPKMAELHALNGQIFGQRGEYQQAIEAFDRALSLKPGLPDVSFFAGMACLRESKFDEALQRFEQELKRDPKHIQAKYHVAFIAILKNEKERAVPLLEEVIRMNPYHAEALYQLGKLQLEKDNLPPAVANLEMAASLEPQKSYIFYQLYRAYLKAGRDEPAQRALERYQTLKGRSP
jgi:tetratricopeptide (TPR) repeat protein